MKFRTLLLSTAGAIAMAGGAQAADLAVAAPGGVCADGWIAVSGWCLQVGIRVREILSIAADGSADADTTARVVFRGMMPSEWGDVGVQVPVEAKHEGAHGIVAPAEDNQVNLVDGTFVYVGGFQFGWFNNPGPGGGLSTDNDSFHPDNGNNNAAQYTFGNVGGGALSVYFSQADTYADGNFIVAGGWSGAMGPASISLNGGYVGRDGTSGWGANVGVTVPLMNTGAKFKVVAAYAQDAAGFATNHAISTLGKTWVVNGSIQVPLGAIVTLGGTVAYENMAGATQWQGVVDLIEQLNAVIQLRQEAVYSSLTGDITGMAWVQGAVGSP